MLARLMKHPQTRSFIFLFLFFPFYVSAQENNDTVSLNHENSNSTSARDTVGYYYRINGKYLKAYWFDLKHVVSKPFHWKGKDWRNFALITGSAGVLFATADKPLREMMLRNQREFFSSAAEVFYPLGNRFPPLLLAGMYVTSVVAKNRKLEHSTLSIAKGLAISTAVYTGFKVLIRRQRPTRTDDPHLFVAPFTGNGYTSFPSGHANTAFSVATGFALQYKDSKWVPWVAYSLATLTSVARMYQDRHWSSDVLVGAAIGHFVTKTVYRLENKRQVMRKTY